MSEKNSEKGLKYNQWTSSMSAAEMPILSPAPIGFHIMQLPLSISLGAILAKMTKKKTFLLPAIALTPVSVGLVIIIGIVYIVKLQIINM